MDEHGRGRRTPAGRDDAGVTMVASMVGLVAAALVVALLVGASLGKGSASTGGPAGGPGVARADAAQAQQTLSTALEAVATAASGGGSLASVDTATLSAAEPALTFVSGPSTGPSTVSVASTPGGSGNVTLADRSTDGTCWLVWEASDAPVYYGAEPDQAACDAPALAAPPTPSAGIDWQQSSFPAG